MTMLIFDSPKLLQRKEIADVLWPASDPTKARASLRQTISELKRAFARSEIGTEFLEGAVLGGAQWQVETEIERLEPQVQSVEDFARLVSLVSQEDEILSSLGGVGPEFDAWLFAARARISKSAQKKLMGVYEAADAQVDVRIMAADAALRLNEYDESAVRAKMASYAAQNENGLALKTYADFVDLLDEDLGAEPSLKTQDLAVEIKLAVEPAAASVPAAVAGPREVPLSLAVLPFEAMGSDPLDRFVTLGILDQVTCWLAMHKVPAIISSNTTRAYLNREVRVRDVGAELGTSYVVTGSTRSMGDSVAFAVQLCDATSEHVVWSWVHTCGRHEIVEANSALAQQITAALHPSIDAEELSRTWNLDDADLEPYHLMLRAKDRMFRLTYHGFEEAGVLLSQAIDKSPGFAPAHALLAEWYSIRYWQKWSDAPDRDFELMNDHVRRAMSLAPGNGRIMAMWGHFKVVLERNYDAAIELFGEAVRIFPNDSETLMWSVPTLAYAGLSQQAVVHAEKAARLSPYDPFSFRNEHFLSIAYYSNGDFDRAAQYGLSSFKRVPSYTSNLRTTIASLTAAGRQAELPDLLDAHALAEPNFSVNRFIPKHGFRDDREKERYGARLIEAGLAP
ncbi:MAG: BTAD domain-containing putative transcriptional regulator [Pseudomonadota bacterium]